MKRIDEKIFVMLSILAILLSFIMVMYGVGKALEVITAGCVFSAMVIILLTVTAYAFKKEETKS